MDLTVSVITIGRVLHDFYIIFISVTGCTVSEAPSVTNEDSECRPHLTVNCDI